MMVAESGICPICGAPIHKYTDLEFDGDAIVRNWECKCGATGYEAYNLEFEFCGHWGVRVLRPLGCM